MVTKYLLPAALALLFVAGTTDNVLAGLASPVSFKQDSADGRFVLVMVSPLSLEDDLRYAREREPERRAIRDRYTESGLYRNDGSTTPLWTIGYCSPTCEAFISPDGKHVVLFSDDWLSSHGHVVTFLDYGTVLASYTQEDLWQTMPSMKWKHLVRSFRSPDAEAAFDATALTLTLRTEAGELFVFDAATGTIARQATPWPMYFALSSAAPIFVLAAGGAFFLMWRKRRIAGSPNTGN